MMSGSLRRSARRSGDGDGMRRATCGRRILAVVALGVVFATGACAFEPPRAIDDATARIIVRFSPGSRDPSDAAFVAQLVRDANLAGLEPIRPMSGDAFVMRVACGNATPAAPDPCAAALARLRTVPGVVDVEIDAREKPLQ